jgi:hypothetical protein
MPAALSQPSPDVLPSVPVNTRAVIQNQPYWISPSTDPDRNLDSTGHTLDTDSNGIVDYVDDIDLNSDGDIDDNGEMNNVDTDNDGSIDCSIDWCNVFYGPKKKYVAFTFDGGQEAMATQVSTLTSHFGPQSKFCEGWNDNGCRMFSGNNNHDYISGFVNLPPCSQGIVTACIEGVRVGNASSLTQGTFDRLVDNSVDSYMRTQASTTEGYNNLSITRFQDDATEGDATTWNEDTNLKLPAGSSPSLWNVLGQTNAAGTETYMARATLQVNIANGEISFTEFSAEIVPFVEVEEADGYSRYDQDNNGNLDDPLTFEPPIWYERNTNPNDPASLGIHHRPMLHQSASFSESASVNTDPLVCAWEELNKCGVAVRFASGTIGELTVRIPKSLGGWFHGRLSEADLDMTSYSSDLNRLVVSGKSVDVPMTSAFFPLFAQNGATPTSYQQYWQDQIRSWDNGESLDSYRLAEEVERGGMATASWWRPDSSGSLDDFIRYSPTLSEEAKGMNNAWRFATLPSQGSDHSCFSDNSRIQGMITTNAMVYQAGLPLYADGKFKYEVAGVHKNYDGSVFKGNYDLVMRADDARCLYGLPLVVPDAKVSVKDSLGNLKSFQSSVTLDGEWLEIHASDFTFSVPSIEVEFREYVAPTISNPDSSTSTEQKTQVSEKATPTNSVVSISVAKGKSRTSKAILADAGIKLTKGQKATISIKKASKKFCSVSGSKVKAKKKGTCSYTVTVKNKKGKKVSTKAGSFTVS